MTGIVLTIMAVISSALSLIMAIREFDYIDKENEE